MKRIFSFLPIVVVAFEMLRAQVPIIVKDINPGPADGIDFNGEEGITALNGIAYFPASDGTHGSELWRSDGTEAGTYMVKDINPGANSSSPVRLTVLGNKILFFANDGIHGDELWITDGIEDGTQLVADINPGMDHGFRKFYLGNAHSTIELGGIFYFSGDSGSDYSQLWRSDGTEAGTYLIADVCPSCNASNYATEWFTALNNELYFFANGDFIKSDGTPGGTVVILPGSAPGTPIFPERMTNAGGKLYFSAGVNTVLDAEPWVSDGTSAGTHVLKDISPGSSSHARYFTEYNGLVYFTAQNKLWQTDGTETGTYMFMDIQVNDVFSAMDGNNFAVAGDRLFFNAKAAVSGSQFYHATNGSPGNISQLQFTDYFTFYKLYPAVYDSKVYFTAKDEATFHSGIGISDGTTGGSAFVIIDGTNSSLFRNLIVIGDILYFFYSNNTYGVELWKFPLAEPTPLTISLLITNPINCFDDENGVLTVNVTGGNSPYSFAWEPPTISGQNPSDLPAGTYSVTVTDALGNTMNSSTMLTEPDKLWAITDSTPQTVNLEDGTAEVVVFGGTPPCTFLWDTSPPVTTATVVGLLAGDYTVTVTDAHGCTITESVIVDLFSDAVEKLDNQLTIVPTLSTGYFTIKSEWLYTGLEVKIVDQFGRVARHWQNVIPGETLDISRLPEGNIYYVYLFHNGYSYFRKLMLVSN